MSGRMRLAIIAASLCSTIALIWGAAGLTMLFMRWTGRHESMAEVMRHLPVFVLSIVGSVLYYRHRRAAT
jgi:hypothetical protein